jgi:predicted phage terminase large subunit-like protein
MPAFTHRTTTMPQILLPEPLPHQLDVLLHPARIKVVVCGRRWGKSLAGLIACIEGHGPPDSGFRGALQRGQVWWVAPTYPQGLLIWRDLKKALQGAWAEKREKEMRIVLPGGGSITVKSADDPDALRGVGLDGVVLDEAAFMKEEAWINGIRPALADRQGWALFLTTPCGMNWIADLFQTAETSEGWARWQRPTSDNPIIPRKELEDARRDMGELQFAQEHLAQFVTAGAGMFKPEWLEHRYEVMAENHYRLPGGETIHADRTSRFAVVDLAVSTKTSADYTVIGAFYATSDRRILVREIDRRRLEGPDIVPAMHAMVERHRLSAIWVEKVAFQLSLIQQARREGLPVRELVPDKDKVARAMPATAACEGGHVLLPRTGPWIRDFVDEVVAFPVGAHDDQVDVLSYAVEVGRRQEATSLFLLGASDADEDDEWDGSLDDLGLPRDPRVRSAQWDQICRDMRLG